MFEKLNKMKEQVKNELTHIPRGTLEQNFLRMYYWPLRMRSLKGGTEHKTKKQVLQDCIDMARKDNPNFKPDYDRDFFDK